MKIYFFILILIPQLVLSQQVKVLYSRSFDLPDAKHLKNYTPDAITHLKKKSYDYLLKNNESSLYFPIETNEDFFDSDTTNVSDRKKNIRVVTIKRNTGTVAYINWLQNYYIEKVQIKGKEYFIKDTLPKLKWEILPERKKIKDYIAQKATTNYNGNKIIAWFAEDIPINAGPRIYHGLPGLIMQLRINKLSYKVEKIEFVKKLPPLEPPKHKGKYMTAEENMKILKKFPSGHHSRVEKCTNCPQ